MAFRNKNSDTILESLINWTASKTDKLTDFNPGSAVRTLYESVSLQIEEFYYDLTQAIKYAVANACYNAFGFSRASARKASGRVTIFFKNPLVNKIDFNKGTVFHTGHMRLQKVYFESTEQIRALEGATSCSIPVVCTVEGNQGNVKQGEICKLQVGNGNIERIANLEAFTSGKDRETAGQREQRFREYVHTLARGGRDAIAYGIKQTPGVQGVYVDDTTVGFVVAYVHDKDGNLTDELKERVLNQVDKYRSAGIEVSVRPIVKKEIDLDLKVYYRPGVNPATFDKNLKDLVVQYLMDFEVGRDLNISTLVTVVNDKFRDIIAYMDVEYEKDIPAIANELIRPGKVEIISKVADSL